MTTQLRRNRKSKGGEWDWAVCHFGKLCCAHTHTHTHTQTARDSECLECIRFKRNSAERQGTDLAATQGWRMHIEQL